MFLEFSRRRALPLWSLVCLGTLVSGCLSDNEVTNVPPEPPVNPPPPVTPPPPPPPPPPPATGIIASSKARVRFLGGQRYARRLASGLGLAVNELCKELGRFDCVDDAHNIVLGGVDAENLGFYEPLPVTTVTTPFAVDRVALSACIQTAQRDLDQPENAAIFTLVPDENGRVAADDPALSAAVNELYVRLLQRRPEAEETEAVVSLYADIESTPTTSPAADWAIASCFAVATTAEALFY